MRSPDCDGHPADPDGQWITPERPEMERFDRDAFIKPEMAKAAGFRMLKRIPIDRRDIGACAERQLIERERFGFEWRVHLATDYH